MNRLPKSPTQHIDPQRRIAFSYRGRALQGVAGDTVATALFASGERIFSRSHKYHRPRGLYSLDGESSTCMVSVDRMANVRGEITPLTDGMAVEPQNVAGSPEFDLLSVLDWFGWAMPAGFYYKVFHRPYRLWPFFMKRIRKAAGLGRIDPSWEGGEYENVYLHADVCVVGGGPAGMAAAQAASEQGLRVVLLEARPRLGGFYDWRVSAGPDGMPLYERAQRLEAELKTRANVRIFQATRLIGAYTDNLITAIQRGGDGDGFTERYLEIRAGSVVVATGCGERPLIFQNNERPGVMQGGCAHRLARTYGLMPGRSAVFSANDDLMLEAALDLADLGLDVTTVVDGRPDGQDPALVQALADRRIPFVRGWVASEAHGGRHVTGVTVSSTDGARSRKLACDLLVASAGLNPVTGPLHVAGARMAFDPRTGFFTPSVLPPRVHAAGRLLGYGIPESIEASGRLAGLAAAAECGAGVGAPLEEARRQLEALSGPAVGSKLVMAPGKGTRRFVCFDEDVTVKNVYQACDQGLDAVELAKRFTAAGTGPSQSGIPGVNLPHVLSQAHMESMGSVVPSTVRAPLSPALMATLAGPGHDVFKRTPLHDVQEGLGGVFRRIGVWKRARYFSSDFSCRAEIENVRNNVGMIDVSTLGKFRLFGPDALKALQRVYVSDMSKMTPGRLKYSAMCNEDGCVIDDGVVTLLGENDYYFTTSTARAGATAEWIRYHTRTEGWDFHIVNLSDAFGAINIAGPNSRAVLRKITDADVSNEAFPYIGFRQITLKEGIPARAMRVGFVGELAYELHVPSSLTQAVWDMVKEAGKEFNIRPFGLEAQNVLRLEKGHVIIGTETELRTTLLDVHMGFLWSREKTGTVGGPALRFAKEQEPQLKLVGFKMNNPAETPRDGSIVVDTEVRGHVCTVRYSAALKESIGFALVEPQLAKMGGRLEIFQEGTETSERLYATVVPTPFYDSEGARLKM